VAANAGAINHVLPVVGQSEINQRLQESISGMHFLGLHPEVDYIGLSIHS